MKPVPPTVIHRQRFVVPFAYNVVFTERAFAPENEAVVAVLCEREPTRRHRVCFVIDAGVIAAWPELPAAVAAYCTHHRNRIDPVGAPLVVKGGEAAKTDPTLIETLLAHFHGHHLDRHAFVLVIGGGGVLDAVGYAAAIAHRGLRLVRMPTTVLAQNDSGVGVKNGVNAFGAKNFLGVFAPPFAVINDFAFLARLPARERTAGLAEAVKVALIRSAAFFVWIEAHAPALARGDAEPLAHLIRCCAELHMNHIATGGDPFEQGSARPLDFGHWAAHRLETLTGHELRHGEAVALGLALDAHISELGGLLREPDRRRISAALRALGLPLWHEAMARRGPDGRLQILSGLDDFREHLGGDLTVALLTGLGTMVNVHELDEAAIETAVERMHKESQA